MDYETIRFTTHGPAVLVTLDRPERLNALAEAGGQAPERAAA